MPTHEILMRVARVYCDSEKPPPRAAITVTGILYGAGDSSTERVTCEPHRRSHTLAEQPAHAFDTHVASPSNARDKRSACCPPNNMHAWHMNGRSTAPAASR
eukprot:2064539-Pleurochrysis_carterae.AAC.1